MNPFDVIVIGGSFAGLSAALQLGRARRSVLVIDGGKPRNRFAKHSHGFLGQDGRPPADILADARAQLAMYPTVRVVSDRVESVVRRDSFVVDTEEGEYAARRLILAYGVRDLLPPVEGLRELWGTGVFHCPYCHGYEVRDEPLGVLGNGPIALHQAIMLPDWSQDVILFTNGPAEFEETDRARLDRRGVRIEETPVARLIADGDALGTVELADGRRVSRAALLTASRVEPTSDFAATLGCEMEEGPLGTSVRTDAFKATTVPGVFAAGDLARMPHSVALAVADGALAGAMAHRSSLAEDWG